MQVYVGGKCKSTHQTSLADQKPWGSVQERKEFGNGKKMIQPADS